MAKTIAYALSLAESGGSSLSGAASITAEAIDTIKTSIPGNSVETTVNVQPSLLTKLKAIMIKAASYASLTFTVDSELTEHTLDAPLCLIGEGNIALLGATVNDLKFTNAGTSAIEVEIMVVRDAV